eukprot:4779221-Ditylum_brightwellii.AAC.1
MFPVTYHSSNSQGFLVHESDGTVRSFRKLESKLLYLAVNAQETVLLNTVEANKINTLLVITLVLCWPENYRQKLVALV